eukprot:1432950-Pyramimonas_sp.AAC.1
MSGLQTHAHTGRLSTWASTARWVGPPTRALPCDRSAGGRRWPPTARPREHGRALHDRWHPPFSTRH